MSLRHLCGLVAAFGLLVVSFPVAAQEDAPPVAEKGAEEAQPLSAKEVEKLIEELDANRFSERQAAQQKLADAGKAVFPALEKATQSISREVATRALDILQKHFAGGDDGTKAAAKESLERLAKTGDAALARRAKEILAPPAKGQSQVPPGVPAQPGVPAFRIGGGQIQIQVVAGAGGKRVQMKTNNGVKEIEAEENGRKVKITDDPAEGIKMEVTEKKDGKEATQKYAAKDAAELKTKHPEAHKLYEEYSQGGANIQIQGFAIPAGAIPPGAVPPGFPGVPGVPGVARAARIKLLPPDELKAVQEKVAAALKELEEAAKELGEGKNADEVKKGVEKVQAAKKLVEELQAQLAK